MKLDNDTLQKGIEGPYEAWEGDHTALVHVLWAAKHDGLTLEKDFDTIASMILHSRFLAARTQHAIDAHDRAKALKALHDAVDGQVAEAERHERRAEETRAELADPRLPMERFASLQDRIEKSKRFAADARERAQKLIDAGA